MAGDDPRTVADVVLEGDERFVATTGTGRTLVFGDAVEANEYSPVETIVAALAACSAMDVIVDRATRSARSIDRYEVHAVGDQRDEYPQVLTEVDRHARGLGHGHLRAGDPALHRAVGDEVLPGQRDGLGRRDRRSITATAIRCDGRGAEGGRGRGRRDRPLPPPRHPRAEARLRGSYGLGRRSESPTSFVGAFSDVRSPDARRPPETPDADRHTRRRRRPPAQGADDRPARPPVRRRRLGGPPDRGVPDRDAPGSSRSSCCRSASAPRSACATRSTARSGGGSSRSRSLGPTEPEHEYPPRFAQVLGSVALILVADRVRARRDGARLAVRARGRRPADAARRDRLLPRLPAVLPALVGAGSRDPDLDARRELEPAADGRADRTSGRAVALRPAARSAGAGPRCARVA